MLQMEGLIERIIASPLFKDQLQKQIQQLTKQQSSPHFRQQQLTMSSLIQEVSSYITEITEFTLEEENSKNYIAFMKRNQELYVELEKRVKSDVDRVAASLKEEIKVLTNKINAAPLDKHHVESKLKQERKMLTQNLLEASRLHNNLAEESLNIKKTFKNIKSSIHQHSENMLECEGSSTIISQSSKHKLAEVMEEWRNMAEEWSSVQAAMGKLKKEQDSQRQEWTTANKNSQAKIQANLQSIWNVISDLCSRISKFQSQSIEGYQSSA